ncbi:MAG: caspase family protein [Bacteroidota bacterium]
MDYMNWKGKIIVIILLIIGHQTVAQQPKLILQAGNTGRVNLMDITTDKKYLANAYGSQSIHLWEIDREKILNTYRHDGRVTALAFTNDNHHLLAGTTTGSIYSRKFRGEEKNFQIVAHSSAVNDFDLSHNDSLLVSCGADSTVKVWDLNERSLKFKITGDYNPFQKIAIDSERSLIYAGDSFGNLLIYNFKTKEEEYYNQILKVAVRDISLDPDKNLLLLAGAGGNIYQVSLAPVEIERTISSFDNAAFSISATKDIVVSTGRDKISNIRLYDFNKLDSLIPHPHDFIKQEPKSDNFQYGIYTHSRAGSMLAVSNAKNEIVIYDLLEKKISKTLAGLASPVLATSFYDDKLLFSTGRNLGKHDLLGFAPMERKAVEQSVQKLFRISNNDFFGYANSGELLDIDPKEMDISTKKMLNSSLSSNEVEILPRAGLLVYKKNDKKVIVENYVTGKDKNLRVKKVRQIRKTEDGSIIAFLTLNNDLEIYSAELKPNLIRTFNDQRIRTFALSNDGKQLAYLCEKPDGKSLLGFDIASGQKKFSIPLSDTTTIDEMLFSPDGQLLFTYARSVGKFNQQEDYSLSVWDLQNGRLKKRLSGHNGFINHVTFNPSNQWLVSSGMDGTIRFWSMKDLSEKLLLIPLDDGEWVSLTPDGRFDASPNAMSEIHFMFENERLPLDQMKKNFYEPKLAEKILGYLEKPFLTDLSHKKYTLYPKIEFLNNPNKEGVLKIGMKDQGGGIGAISVSINNKETVEDARQLASYDKVKREFTYIIEDHPFLKVGELNQITIEAYNEIGYSISNKRKVYFIDKRQQSVANTSSLFALVIGVSDYGGDELDLKFAAKDALDFTNALRLGAEDFLGKDKVHIYPLNTTAGAEQPTKENIKYTFEKIAKVAKPNDILLVYMAGHGMDLEEDDEFYFITKEAEKTDVGRPDSIRKVSISTTELVKMIKRVPAIKQLLIVDACHSGSLLNSSFNEKGELNAESIKALEFLKDRTGTFVLASSEGKEVSYESTILNQGVLTYSLLFGLKGAGLYDGELVDAKNLINYASRKVPSLAEDIGQSQQPVIKMPPGQTSFQFGRLSNKKRQEISLESTKSVVVRSHFHKKQTLYDDLHISEQLDEKIRELRNDSSQSYIFLDENHFNNAYSVYGHYHHENEKKYEIVYKIFKDERSIFESSVKSYNLDHALDEIALRLTKVISEDSN